MQSSQVTLALDYIKKNYRFTKPLLGLILGSGQGELANTIEPAATIPYENIPGFPETTVHGHSGKLVLGTLNDCPVACLSGRAHLYEHRHYDSIKTMVYTLRKLGCETLLLTNAAGSLREDMKPGELMLITDHMNFQSGNPLAGPNDDETGPRFVDLTDAYDPDINQQLLTIAEQQDITLHQGVFIATNGPTFETAAEIKAYRLLGASSVAMSTVPEVMVARHCKMTVAAISVITNFATGVGKPHHHQHEDVVTIARQSTEQLSKLVGELTKHLNSCLPYPPQSLQE